MAVTQYTYIPNRVIDSNGIADGASLYFYLTGTTTLQTIYADAERTTPLTNPVVVDAGAPVPTVYLNPAVTYRVRVVSSSGAVISDTDPYDGAVLGLGDLAFAPSNSGPFKGFIQADDPVWIGSYTVNNSSLPLFVGSRNIVGDAANWHCFTDSSNLVFSNDYAYNSYDARVTIGGSGLMDHYAAFQVGPVKTGSGTLQNLYSFFTSWEASGGTLDNYYGLFVQQPNLSGGATVGRAVGLLFNGIPRDYGNVANPNYLFYSNGSGGTAALAYSAGQICGGKIVASASEITAGAMVHANTPAGTSCSIRVQQQSQNWWDMRIDANQIYLSWFESVGGGVGTERLRLGSGANGALTPAADNTQDCGTAALSWRGVYADTGFYHTGVKVVGAQGAAVADATGGATIDTEARAAINALLARLRAHGLIAT